MICESFEVIEVYRDLNMVQLKLVEIIISSHRKINTCQTCQNDLIGHLIIFILLCSF